MTERFQRQPSILHSTIDDDDVVALSVERGLCYAMPGTTAAIWRLLEEPRSLDALTAALLDKYDVDKATCRRDVTEVLDKMEREGLVRRITGSAACGPHPLRS